MKILYSAATQDAGQSDQCRALIWRWRWLPSMTILELVDLVEMHTEYCLFFDFETFYLANDQLEFKIKMIVPQILLLLLSK